MERLSDSRRSSLWNAAVEFYHQLPGSPAEEFLATRGLQAEDISEAVNKFNHGNVADPLPGFEQYQGMLAIPYLRRHPRHSWSCISLRFRTLKPGVKPKYQSMPGDKPRLFNTQALNVNTPTVGITEGELDAVTATACGLPTVGVPGAQLWQPHWSELFRGYETVYIFTDGDEPGAVLGNTVASRIPQSKVRPAPPGMDLNDLLLERGADELRNYLHKA